MCVWCVCVCVCVCWSSSAIYNVICSASLNGLFSISSAEVCSWSPLIQRQAGLTDCWEETLAFGHLGVRVCVCECETARQREKGSESVSVGVLVWWSHTGNQCCIERRKMPCPGVAAHNPAHKHANIPNNRLKRDMRWAEKTKGPILKNDLTIPQVQAQC